MKPKKLILGIILGLIVGSSFGFLVYISLDKALVFFEAKILFTAIFVIAGFFSGFLLTMPIDEKGAIWVFDI